MITTWEIVEIATGKVVGSIKCADCERALNMWCWIWKQDASKFDWKRT